MIVVKIFKKAQSFLGVQYNTNKVELDRGELMAVQNFQALQGIGSVKPGDYVNYLRAVINRNHLIKSPQFHAVISCREKEKDKHELTLLAQQWMKEMGYGKNPYLLIFHKDTRHNHIHIVSSRVDKQARLIDTGFTYIRATKLLNQLTGVKEDLAAGEDLNLALSYRFSSLEQFKLVLGSLGYSAAQKEGEILLCRFGRKMISVEPGVVAKSISAGAADHRRALAIRRMIERQKSITDPAIEKKSSFFRRSFRSRGFISALTEELRQKSGLHFFFHNEPGRLPTAFTVIDHTTAQVFNGIDIMPLQMLVTPIRNEDVVKQVYPGGFPELHIADDVDDEAAFGRKRRGNNKDHPQELTR